MNQEPKPTIEQLLDECFTLAKIATPGYKPYLQSDDGDTYRAICSYSCTGHSTAAEALIALKAKLYSVAATKKGELQKRMEELQQQMNGLNSVAEQVNALTTNQ